MRAPGLAKLTVHSCKLVDKYADFNTSAEHIRDCLRELDMHDCIWLDNPEDLDRVLSHTDRVSRGFQCGQESSLRSFVYRNITDTDECSAVLATALESLNLTWEQVQSNAAMFDNVVNQTKAMGGRFQHCADRLAASSGPGESVESTGTGRDALKSRILLAKFQNSCVFHHLEVTGFALFGLLLGWVLVFALCHDAISFRILVVVTVSLFHAVDESYNEPMDKQYFEDLVRNSEYPQLRSLNYSFTKLGEVPNKIRQWRVSFKNSKMQIMNLSHNRITEVGRIEPYPNTDGKPSTTLDLQYNDITQLSFQMFEEWAQVPDFFVDIRNNPVDCNCNIKDLLTELQDGSKWVEPPMIIYRSHLSVMECATPPELSGSTIGSLTEGDLECPVVIRDSEKRLRVVIATMAVVCLLVLGLLMLAVKYRQEVKILVFTRMHILLRCTCQRQDPSDSPDKVYDAFVAYAHQDSDWVVGTLVKRLEEPCENPLGGSGPVRLCIHQRDFIVGKPIIDNIVDCIAASKHTLVILSTSFVKSCWAMEELHQAYCQSLEERRCHLVIVVLEQVKESDMTPLLRRCCKTFTYIHVDDSLFWDRLQYSIKVDNIDTTTATHVSVEHVNQAFQTTEEGAGRNDCNIEDAVQDAENAPRPTFDIEGLFTAQMQNALSNSTCNTPDILNDSDVISLIHL
ncbi:toll-like receptor 2 type-2 [Littorina saxatilis]|uniref:TIR domain-containing protein n=1 Tax=Littorina saxatilis TaxID=31220 RepID=A0AAN9AY82_9CAEN